MPPSTSVAEVEAEFLHHRQCLTAAVARAAVDEIRNLGVELAQPVGEVGIVEVDENGAVEMTFGVLLGCPYVEHDEICGRFGDDRRRLLRADRREVTGRGFRGGRRGGRRVVAAARRDDSQCSDDDEQGDAMHDRHDSSGLGIPRMVFMPAVPDSGPSDPCEDPSHTVQSTS